MAVKGRGWKGCRSLVHKRRLARDGEGWVEEGQGTMWDEDLMVQAIHSKRSAGPGHLEGARLAQNLGAPSLPASSLQPPPPWGLAS